MSNIRFTMKDLDGTVMPYTSFVISTGTSANAASFTTNLNGEATVTLAAVSTPYYISKQDGTTESVIAYKFFVPDTTYTLDAELLFVDMGKISKDKNDKSIAALIEAKVVAVNAANRALQVVSLLGDVSTIRANLTNLVQVASNLTNINTVSANATNINTVSANATNINTVAGNTTNINKVATIDTNVTTVASNIAPVVAVGNNINNINAVRAMEADLEAIADNIAYLSNASAAVTQGVDAQKELFINGTDYTKNTSSFLALTYLPAKTNSVKVFFDGVYQNKNTFTRVGKVITFNEAINVDNVEIHYEVPSQFVGLDDDDNAVLVAAQNAAQASEVDAQQSATAAAVSASLAQGVATQAVDAIKQLFVAGTNYTKNTSTQLTMDFLPVKTNAVKVFFDGVYQNKNTFTRVGKVITFNEAINVDNVEIHYEVPSQFVGLDDDDNAVLVAAQNAAQASANAAAASFDSFDDRYLGAKSVAPTVDNDGNVLLVGAKYFNSTENKMYVRNSSNAWQLDTADSSTVTYDNGTVQDVLDAVTGPNGAASIGCMPAGGLSSINVQTALVELDSEKQPTLVSGTNIKTINNASILGSGNINISGGAATATDVTFTPSGGLSSTNMQTALVELDSEKQVTLVSGTNIKTINGSSILGSGNIAISGGASDASSVTFAPVGNIASTSVQAAIAELDSEKQITLVSGTNIKTINSSSLLGTGDVALQAPLVSGTTIKTINTNSLLGSGNVSVQPTLVSGTSIKTINGTSLLGSGDISVGSSVVSKIKIAIIGDSGTAQSVFTQEAWPSFLEKNLIAGGMDVEVYNFAIVGERYFTANGAQYESGATQLQKAVAINPDIIVVALGINDALSERSLVEAKADALYTYNTLRTGAPAAKIIYASQIYWDITHKPLATSLLNREIVPFLFQLRTSGFLSGSYCSSILTDAASTTGHAIIAKWKELDTYIKSLPTIDESFNLDGYKVARLGLLGEDFVHPSQDGSKFLAGQVLKAFLTLSSLSTLTASLRTPIFPNWDDPDTMFAIFCESNGSEWVTKASTIASQHISSITSLTRAYRPNNWYMPTRGSMYIGNSNIGSTLPAVAMVEGVKPNTLIEASVNGGAWAATPYITSSHGTAITVDVASNLFIGTHNYYYRIFNEVYGPYTITTTSPTPLTKSSVGLNNVDNTSDANKPVSTATQNALNAKQTTLVPGSNIKTINGTSLLGAGDISVSGGSSEYYVFGSSSSSAYNAPGAECIIQGWSLLTSSGSSVTTNGITFTVPAGAWIVSCSLGITLPPNIGIYSKFRTDGTQSSLTQITGSSNINATGTTSYATSTGSGVVVTSSSTSMIYVALASGGFNLNSEGLAHRVTFMKI